MYFGAMEYEQFNFQQIFYSTMHRFINLALPNHKLQKQIPEPSCRFSHRLGSELNEMRFNVERLYAKGRFLEDSEAVQYF